MGLAEHFKPRLWQAQIIGDPNAGISEDTTKYKVVVAHRKAGKTVMALMYLFMRAYKCKDGFDTKKGAEGGMRIPRFTYIAPTYKQARDIAWDLLKDIVPRWALLKKPNETNMEIRLTNRVILNLKGADKEDTLRGAGLYFALMDEYAFMKPHIWHQVIRPELGQTGGDAMFIGTPFGRDHFYEVFKLGRDGETNWKSWLLPVSEKTYGFIGDVPRGTELLSEGFLDGQKKEMTERFYSQEYECAFRDDAGMVFDRIDENVVDEFRDFPESGHKYRIGVDPALREDFTVLAVIDLTDHKIKYVYRTNKIDLELLLSRIENEANKWTTNMGKPEIIMDTTGMGDPIYEALIGRGVDIQPIKFGGRVKRMSKGIKQKMVDNLAMMFSKDEVKIPRYDWLIDELKDYRFHKMESGTYKYGAPPGKHDDGVVALFLACYQLPPLIPVTRVRNSQLLQSHKPNRFTGY